MCVFYFVYSESARLGRLLLRVTLLAATFAAQAIEIGHMTLYLSVEMSGGGIYDRMDTVHFQVDDLLAGSTDKMVVIGDIRVEVIHTVAHAQPLDLTDIGELRQIPVNRAKADVRILQAHVCVDNVGGRMILAGHQEIFDELSLPTVFHSHCQIFPLFALL